MLRFAQHDRPRRKGLSSVEMALVLPLLLMGTLGAVHYGLLLWRVHQVNDAARTGARVAIRAYSNNTDVGLAISRVMSRSGLGESGYTWGADPLDVAAVAPGYTLAVTVSVSTDRPSIGWLRGAGLFPTPDRLVARVEMPKEGP